MELDVEDDCRRSKSLESRRRLKPREEDSGEVGDTRDMMKSCRQSSGVGLMFIGCRKKR